MDYIVMIVAGQRAEGHYYNETEELFYQLEGQITVRIQEDGQAVDMKLAQGHVPASGRCATQPDARGGLLGLVIERKRKGTPMKDGLMWFCDKCNHKPHDTYFELTNIEKDLPRFREFYGSENLRKAIRTT